MRDQDILYWGMVVTMFLLIAAVLTARELFEQYLEERKARQQTAGNAGDVAGSHD
jgi:hypothetical protein